MATLKSTFFERFWSRVRKAEGDACWEWTACRFPKGYGKVGLPRAKGSVGLVDGAHRIAWILTNGPIPADLWVLHKCDNRACCRPDHLFLGTHQDNMLDMVRKGRHRSGVLGVPNPRRRFTDEQVLEIKRRVAAGESRRAIAREVGMNHRGIARIVKGEIYA